MAKIFLVRHAAYSGSGDNPPLSQQGEGQAEDLGLKIKEALNGNAFNVTIWTSPAERALQTAQIIKNQIPLVGTFEIHEKLWSDKTHKQDFDWLKKEIKKFKGGNLVIVSHLEYVQDFPEELGFRSNSAYYAKGVLIEDKKCVDF